MSHLGMKILYHMMNDTMPDVWCERVFMPNTDMQQLMRENDISLFGLESHEPIKNDDFVGFTLQYELSYTNIVAMLDLAGVPIFAKTENRATPLLSAAVRARAIPNRFPILSTYSLSETGKRTIIRFLIFTDSAARTGKSFCAVRRNRLYVCPEIP